MAFELFVNGTLMCGLKLHPNLGASEFLGEFRTEPRYRVHSIGDIHPGMYRLEEGEEGGAAIIGELYRVEEAIWQQIEAGEPPNLYRGEITLEGGRKVFGILYPRHLAEGYYPDITHYGGWRAYIERQS